MCWKFWAAMRALRGLAIRPYDAARMARADLFPARDNNQGNRVKLVSLLPFGEKKGPVALPCDGKMRDVFSKLIEKHVPHPPIARAMGPSLSPKGRGEDAATLHPIALFPLPLVGKVGVGVAPAFVVL